MMDADEKKNERDGREQRTGGEAKPLEPMEERRSCDKKLTKMTGSKGEMKKKKKKKKRQKKKRGVRMDCLLCYRQETWQDAAAPPMTISDPSESRSAVQAVCRVNHTK